MHQNTIKQIAEIEADLRKLKPHVYTDQAINRLVDARNHLIWDGERLEKEAKANEESEAKRLEEARKLIAEADAKKAKADADAKKAAAAPATAVK